MFGQDLLYCGSCFARHNERGDLPKCKETNFCEVIQGPVQKLHPDNFLPVVVYQKARSMASISLIELRGKTYYHTISRRDVTVETLRFIIDCYRDSIENYGMYELLDKLMIIQQVYDEYYIDLVGRKLRI